MDGAFSNSHTNAISKRWHLWEIDLRFAPGLLRRDMPPFCSLFVAYRFYMVYRQVFLGPVDPSFRALSGRLKRTIRRHKFPTKILTSRDTTVDTNNPHGKTKSTNFRLEVYLDDGSNPTLFEGNLECKIGRCGLSVRFGDTPIRPPCMPTRAVKGAAGPRKRPRSPGLYA